MASERTEPGTGHGEDRLGVGGMGYPRLSNPPGQPPGAPGRTLGGMDANAGTIPQPGASSAREEVMRRALAVAGELPRPQPRSVLCPYCGSVTSNNARCSACGGRFDPLSRQATQNHMGPWSIRDDRSPHRPGCTFDTLCRLVDSGIVGPDTVIRGPSTRQFWTLARHTPGIAHRMGVCHNCRAAVARDAFQCPSCHAPFTVDRDRQHLGVGPTRPLPGQGTPEVLALHAGPPRTPAIEPRDFTQGDPTPAGTAPAGFDAQALARLQESAARCLRTSDLDRQRGVIALVLAVLVVLTSLLYAGLIAERAGTSLPEPQPIAADGG